MTPPDSQKAPTEARRPRRARWAPAAISAAIGLIVSELAVRAFHGTPLRERLPVLRVVSHPRCGWRMVPGEDHYTYHHPVSVNSLGLRGDELAAAEPGELRVLALGDSMVYGQGVGDTETLPHHLERSLARDGGSWRVVNAGHRAYDTAQEMALYEELVAVVEPDVAVLFWFWNDLIPTDVEEAVEILAGQGPASFDLRAPLEGGELLAWRANQLLRRSALLMYLHDLLLLPDVDPLGPRELEVGIERLGRELDRFVRISEREGVRPIVAIVPAPESLAGYHHSRTCEALAYHVARERGIPTFHLRAPLETLLRTEGELPVIPYDGHYQPAANRAMAQRAAREIRNILEAK